MRATVASLACALLLASCSSGGTGVNQPADTADVSLDPAADTAPPPDAAADEAGAGDLEGEPDLPLPDQLPDNTQPGCVPGTGCFGDNCKVNEDCLCRARRETGCVAPRAAIMFPRLTPFATERRP